MTSAERFSIRLAAAGAAVALAACAGMPGQRGSQAQARLEPTQGSRVTGTATFTAEPGGVAVYARVSGLNPGQEHGFHIHEKGDCSSGDGNSAGGHFNPEGKPHGPQAAEHHAGDMPSLRADASGAAEMRFVVAGLTIGAGPRDILGRGLIVHAQADDYRSQPTGNAGARLACGVIG